MDPVVLITGALAAGAAAAAKDAGKNAVKDVYNGLKALIKRKFSEKKKPEGETALVKYEEKPEVWKAPLEDSLVESGVDKDADIIAAAQRLMELIQPRQAAEGKFNIQAESVQGVVQAEKIESLTMNFGEMNKNPTANRRE